MENINNKEYARTARLPKGKPPTRLQKRAPAVLQLDDISSSNNIQSASSIITKSENFSPNAIPLLSPLILSPTPLLPPQPESIIMSCNNNQVQVQAIGTGGWQHPAVTATLPEPSNLFAFFNRSAPLFNIRSEAPMRLLMLLVFRRRTQLVQRIDRLQCEAANCVAPACSV